MNGRCPLRGIHSSEGGTRATAAPQSVSHAGREAYGKSLYGECGWTGRQTGSIWGSPLRGDQARGPHPRPLLGPGLFDLGRGRFGARPGWSKGPVGYIIVQSLKGSLHQLLTEVHVHHSMRVNSTSVPGPLTITRGRGQSPSMCHSSAPPSAPCCSSHLAPCCWPWGSCRCRCTCCCCFAGETVARAAAA